VSTLDADAAVAKVRDFYARISRDGLARIDDVYSPGAYFRDPFNEVRGTAAIRAILERMLDACADCRFDFADAVVDARGALLTWDFTFRMRRFQPDVARRIHGASHLRFDASGRVAYHRDYWDAAGELYETLPGVGSLMRWLRRRIA
jgi:steroid delta-isomerase